MAGYSIGEAFVLDNSGVLNTIARQQQQAQQQSALRQKKLDEENAVAIAQMGKLNGKGLSKPDLPEFNDMYADVKKSYYKYRGAKTDAERIAAKMEVDDKIKDTLQYADNAVVTRRELASKAQHFMSNRDKYDDDVIKDVSAELEKPVSQIDLGKLDPLKRERVVDVKKISGDFDKIDTYLLKNTEEKVTEKKGSEGNKSGIIRTSSREVPLQTQIERYKAEYDGRPDFRHFLNKSYPTLTPDQQLQKFAEARRSLSTLTSKKDEFKSDWRPRAPKGGSGGGSGGDQLIQDWVGGVVSNDPNKIADIRSSLPDKTRFGYSTDGKTFSIDIPSGITPDGKERLNVKQDFDAKDPQFGNKLAYFLKATDIGKNLSYLQKVYKEKGKPSTAYKPVPKTDAAKKSTGRASTKTVNFFKKK